MFIPPNKLRQNFGPASDAGSKVRLKAAHLLIDHQVATEVFGDDANVNMVYYPDRHTLMIAPENDKVFKDLHKTGRHLLKDRNLKGDKSIALHEILIDHQIAETDRDLVFEVLPGLGILKVNL